MVYIYHVKIVRDVIYTEKKWRKSLHMKKPTMWRDMMVVGEGCFNNVYRVLFGGNS